MKTNKWIIMIITGILFITTVCVAYLPSIIKYGMYEFELTFLSNGITGFLFLGGGIYGMVKKKELPQILYMNSVLLLQIVFLVCMAFINEFNFSGAYFFLHIINPVLATAVVMLYTSCRRMPNIKMLITALIFPLGYLIYAMVYGALSGNWLYGILNFRERGVLFVMILIFIIAIGVLILEWIQYKINYLYSRKNNVCMK